MSKSFPILPLYGPITERLNDDQVSIFDEAMTEYVSENYGNSSHLISKLPRGVWMWAHFYTRKMDEYFESKENE